MWASINVMSNNQEEIVTRAIEHFKCGDYEKARLQFLKAGRKYGYRFFLVNMRLCCRTRDIKGDKTINRASKEGLKRNFPSRAIGSGLFTHDTAKFDTLNNNESSVYGGNKLSNDITQYVDNEAKYKGKFKNKLIAKVQERFPNAARQATELTRLAKQLAGKDNVSSLYLARTACILDPKEYRKKWYGFLLFNSGYITESIKVLSTLSPNYKLQQWEKNRINYISGCARLLVSPPVVQCSVKKTSLDKGGKRVLYVASSSRPYHYNGYTSRTHGVIKGIMEHGWEVLCVTRPGYPNDREDRDKSMAIHYSSRQEDGVLYQALDGLHRRNVPLDEYIYHSAQILIQRAITYKPSIIHAASNYEAALPALLAAKELGIKFVYEVRGLWEYTAASRTKGWEHTERFYFDAMLESVILKNADSVATLTSALANELYARGADEAKTFLAPNAIDPERFRPRSKDLELAQQLMIDQQTFVVGYAGSVVTYEGLDLLLDAVPMVLSCISNIKVIIVGDGKALCALKQKAKALNILDKVIFCGRVTPQNVGRYMSLFDIVCLPRKRVKVCELVSPLKPFEAMAMKIPLLMSDVAALKEISNNEEYAYLHEAGSSKDLASKILMMARNERAVSAKVDSAYKATVNYHNWTYVAAQFDKCYSNLLNEEIVL